ncbi:MAG: flagellar basal body L-ring protein FlgH [Robiginitomaculum sp.]|nr:flagellar basal body L-ring protein FlgH [Robiginitomaculum sp.]
MKYLLLTLMSAATLSACATPKPLAPPKALPINWRMDETSQINRPGTIPKQTGAPQTTSLWSAAPRSLFGDRRASQLGDILTVVIEIDEEAQLQNSVSTNSTSQKNLEVGSFFGLPELVAKLLPTGASLKPAVDIGGSDTLTGNGNISRKEKLTLRLAARVNEVLPNGYLALTGRQEIIVNNEVRHLQITGIVRIADISRLNTITYDKIAEARIFYGGRGQLTTATQSKTGNKIIRKILPF